MLNIALKDGHIRQVAPGTTVAALCKEISPGLYRIACAARIDGETLDLRTPLTRDCALEILTFEDEGGKKAYWHTASHIMAQAVKRLYPGVKLTIGPSIDNGFYYDFDADEAFTQDALAGIEAEMKRIIKAGYPIERFELPRDAAEALMADEPYKVELIGELPADAAISFYKQEEFTDLCAGPHLIDTGRVGAVRLLSVTGAYWRANAANKQLQRIYGIAFPKAAALEEYVAMLEEAKKRDHRRLGRELDLYDILEEGPGFPFFFPKGMILRNKLETYWREEHAKHGYHEIRTPVILNEELWHRSGHWEHYQNNMYFTRIDEGDFAIKPMNCPGGMLAYKRRPHSYRDLPQRMAELGLVHRHELSGALHGLMRVRCFTQDDAHIFMMPSQIEDEILGVIAMIDDFYKVFGFSYHVELSTRPENSMGSDEQWQLATGALQNALVKRGMDYVINPGDGAFYGPKIDFHLRDCIGRTWQCGTIQLDFQMPERFDLFYIAPDGEKHRPVMIHRVVFGSIERFIAILTEHFAGAFPLWLSPEQVRIMPISERQNAAVLAAETKLRTAGLRVECDLRNEKVGYKIREAQLQKVPYMLVIGDKEIENGTVSVRVRGGRDLGAMSCDDFIRRALEEIAAKTHPGAGN